MKNEYDNEHFFEQYAQMARSRYGLSGAGEWQQLKEMFPPLKGSRVLDLGCGYGWHCKYAVDQGAEEVLGIDVSVPHDRRGGEAQLQTAGSPTGQVSLEEYEYPEEAWDCVVSNLALHYIEDIESVYRLVYRTLKRGGTFLFNIEHPVFTSGVREDWIYDENGDPLYWPVDDYFYPGERKTRFLGCDVLKYHHTLTQIMNCLLRSGFAIEMWKRRSRRKR